MGMVLFGPNLSDSGPRGVSASHLNALKDRRESGRRYVTPAQQKGTGVWLKRRNRLGPLWVHFTNCDQVLRNFRSSPRAWRRPPVERQGTRRPSRLSPMGEI